MSYPRGPFSRLPVGGSHLFTPLALGNWQLYLDSRLGLSGAHNSIVQPWPDQSGNALDASNDTSLGNTGKMRLQTTSNLSPNGQQTVLFAGTDFPAAAVGLNAGPNPWPPVTHGYTFYAGFNQLTPASSSSEELLWNEGTANLRLVNLGTGTKWEYRDQAGVNRDANTGSANGWQSMVAVVHAAGTFDYVINGATATWQGGWNQQYTINPGSLAGYTLGNLATNYVVGFHGVIGWFFWNKGEHSLATQRLVDNFMRGQFGMAAV